MSATGLGMVVVVGVLAAAWAACVWRAAARFIFSVIFVGPTWRARKRPSAECGWPPWPLAGHARWTLPPLRWGGFFFFAASAAAGVSSSARLDTITMKRRMSS